MKFRHTFHRVWTRRAPLIVGYLIVLQVLTIALMRKVEAVPKALNHIDMATAVHGQYAALVAEHPGVVLLGDSHTWTLGYAPGGRNYGTSGIMVKDIAGTMPHDIARAYAVLLMIGTNDIWKGKTTGLAERIRGMLAQLPKDVPLVWSGIPPGEDFRFDRDEAKAANATIKAMCAARPSCTYIDTWQLLADEAGAPIPELFLQDGVHLSAPGYRVWIEALDAALDEIAESTT
jgi:lysophospholipase L1-like esterase